MSLFGTIQIANNSLIAASIGLQVAGNNIANANTPGYLRQEPFFVTGPTQLIGTLPLGLGVRVKGIVQHVDQYLEERLRGALSDMSDAEKQEDIYRKLEAILGELNDTDLSSSLNGFFGAIHDVLNQPENASVRNLAMLKGQSLSSDMQRFASQVRRVRSEVNDLVAASAADINRLTSEVAKLNIQIVASEGGSSSESAAVGLRDRRGEVLAELAKLIDIRVSEQPTGSVSVYAGGEYLVAEGVTRPVRIAYGSDRGLTTAEIRLAETDAPLRASGGALAGWLTARDTILGGVLDDLDTFAATLIQEFNKVYSSGQGQTGYATLRSEFGVDDEQAVLDNAGLKFTPTNGSFRLLVRNKQTGLTQTTEIQVRLNGLDDDSTLQGVIDQLDQIDGVTADLTTTRQLRITADSPQLEFSFADDTSGFLAALGLNTFFTGNEALNMGVSAVLQADPTKFAASRGGIGADAKNVELLAGLQEQPLASLNGGSLASRYQAFAASIAQGSAVTRSVAEGFRVFQKTLESQKLAISGVSIDDETVKMIQYQRTYQASARVIATIDRLLETLINL